MWSNPMTCTAKSIPPYAHWLQNAIQGFSNANPAPRSRHPNRTISLPDPHRCFPFQRASSKFQSLDRFEPNREWQTTPASAVASARVRSPLGWKNPSVSAPKVSLLRKRQARRARRWARCRKKGRRTGVACKEDPKLRPSQSRLSLRWARLVNR